ncbi:MAG TPA: TlpA disulfide reductase family protein [Bacteroidales bacterium]|nr:TlpA disulfide reductase family protein [Bacteroidales bacterium]HOK97922.1 TlpA disulfide reductase family protein [Bacteroidales bacterium]HPO64498.1 TlpA disulfide reductase family protein [Bacteroidales bacterium]
MRVSLLLLLFLAVFLPENLSAGQVIIEGNHTSYAGKTLAFATFQDPFTGKDSIIATCKVDSTGCFRAIFQIEQPQLIYTRLGALKGYLHVEPNQKYVISLPEWQDMSPADKLNPFFEPIEFQFSLENDTNANSLNRSILQFDTLYFKYLAKFTRPRNINRDTLNQVKNMLLSLVTNDAPIFFKDYATYKIGLLELLAMQYRVKHLSKQYFENKPLLYNNEAYLDLFNRVYDKYFYYFGQSLQGKSIYNIINDRKDYRALDSLLQNDPVLTNAELRTLVILKNLHDEFYASRFSRSGLLNILDSLIKYTTNTIHKQYALSIREKITRLMPGYAPPAFSLYDRHHRLVNLSDFKGYYVYLNFCSCQSYACLKEFDLLGNLAQKYSNKNFIIVTVVIDEDTASMLPYAEKASMNWIFLHYGHQPDVVKKYDIRGFPTYYLIGPDGKLLLSPAKSPGEYFELDLFKIMRARGDM